MQDHSQITAVLLCGGKGERLRPFTSQLPKPLVPLHGLPLLQHLLDYLRSSGIRRFRICVGYKAELIESFIRDYDARGCDIACVNSGDASMTDRILDARPAEPALICYGDTLANVDISELRRAHEQSKALATLTVYPFKSPFGIVELDAQARVTEFHEKPQLPYWINIGYLLCGKQALALLEPVSEMVAYLGRLKQSGRLHAFRHVGRHLTVNTEKERESAENAIVEFFTIMHEEGE